MIYGKLFSEDSKCYDFVTTGELRKSCMLASKYYRNYLEKQKAERTVMENSFKCKAMVDELETVKGRKQETEQIVKELRKNSDTELLKTDEKQNHVARSKATAFLKAAM